MRVRAFFGGADFGDDAFRRAFGVNDVRVRAVGQAALFVALLFDARPATRVGVTLSFNGRFSAALIASHFFLRLPIASGFQLGVFRREGANSVAGAIRVLGSTYVAQVCVVRDFYVWRVRVNRARRRAYTVFKFQVISLVRRIAIRTFVGWMSQVARVYFEVVIERSFVGVGFLVYFLPCFTKVDCVLMGAEFAILVRVQCAIFAGTLFFVRAQFFGTLTVARRGIVSNFLRSSSAARSTGGYAQYASALAALAVCTSPKILAALPGDFKVIGTCLGRLVG